MKYLLLLPLLFTSVLSSAQEFPKDWIGNYSGNMIIGNIASNHVDTILVNFEMNTVEEDSSWSYKMTYISDRYGEVIKDYKIVATRKGEQKKYVLDENNGIVMELSYMDGTFYGMYDVMDIMFVSTLRYADGDIYFDLFGADLTTPKVTASEDEDGIVEATSYRTTFHQTVLLKRQK